MSMGEHGHDENVSDRLLTDLHNMAHSTKEGLGLVGQATAELTGLARRNSSRMELLSLLAIAHTGALGTMAVVLWLTRQKVGQQNGRIAKVEEKWRFTQWLLAGGVVVATLVLTLVGILVARGLV